MQASFKVTKGAYEACHLLDLKMPDGRALRTYTAKDCLAHGGWLTDVGQRVRRGWEDTCGDPNIMWTANRRTIGEVYKETELGWAFLSFHWLDYQWSKVDPSNNAPGDDYDGFR